MNEDIKADESHFYFLPAFVAADYLSVNLMLMSRVFLKRSFLFYVFPANSASA